MHHFNWGEFTQWVLLNGGAVAWSFHYHWWQLIPQPDHILEWMIGLMVGVSLMSLNATKLYFLIKEKRSEIKRKRRAKAKKP